MTKEFIQNSVLSKKVIILSLLFVLVPFLFVKFVPSTDLPQHVAQMRLLDEIRENPQQTTYTVNWFGANSLVYVVLYINWILFDHVFAGKMCLLEICFAWCISIFLLAWHKRRSSFSAVLACVFIFNTCFYWGFLNFFVGFPFFILWYIVVIDRNQVQYSPTKEFLLICIISIALFFAHALWLVAAVSVFIIVNVYKKTPVQRIGIQGIGLIPIFIYSAIWYPKLIAARTRLQFNMDMHWIAQPWERFHPQWIMDILLGGVRGIPNSIIYIGIFIWICTSIITRRKEFRLYTNVEFLLVGIFFLLFTFLGPDQYVNTILFSARWFPVGVIFLLLSLPSPKIPISLSFVVVLLLAGIFSAFTALQWAQYETTENTGLESSLRIIPDGSRVLGLDCIKASDFIRGRPFLQTFAYAQVLHGGELNFSFAEHQSSIVSVIDTSTMSPWTRGLEWSAQRVTAKDFSFFDYALINGTEESHQVTSSVAFLRQITIRGKWRLYQCLKDTNLQQVK